jgi:hypothetical protein
MTEFICMLLWVACIGLAWVADLNALKHIAKGYEGEE